MSQSTLSRELALAIGLAARDLSDTPPKQLLDILIDALGLPLTDIKLKSLTLKDYQRLVKKDLRQSYSDKLLQHSFARLQKLQISTDEATDIPQSIRVAITSQDGDYIDSQFSLCKRFYIYQVSAQQHKLIAIRFAETEQPLKSEKKQSYRAGLIKDCQVLYSLSIGGPATAKIIKQGVHPIKLSDTSSINNIIEQLQYVLSTSPPPWLAKTMGLAKSSLTHTLEDETI